jgi:hypothetical protein
MKTPVPPQVGAPDPERKTSPILDRQAEDLLSLDLELETGVCYFNDATYALGEYVYSGEQLLHCEERGLWIPKE